MAMKNYLLTSESVTEGHPDKIADTISDAVLDAIIAQDKKCRVACESMVTTGLDAVAGEITTDCYVHFPDIVRTTIKEIGYTDSSMGFDYATCSVTNSIDRQSPDIAMGVARPVSVMINTFGTSKGMTPDQIAAVVSEVFDFRPSAIIKKLGLLRPIYKETAAYGHFGRADENFFFGKNGYGG
ncbi:MAG: methionine adenosyltransferase domain-containing protein [Deltaproteobacteria bacterium]|nr:methionine adenosyltransferase domain-containing protein [Deltaproteobacteria bacterium]